MQHWNKGLPLPVPIKKEFMNLFLSLKFRASYFLLLFGQRMTDFQKLS